MSDVWLSIVMVVVFVLIGGVFAGAEIALVSLRDSQARALADRGRRGQEETHFLVQVEVNGVPHRNHERAGQNVLYVTGEVRFQSTPYCGYGSGWTRDNIYTAYAPNPLPPGSNPSPQARGVLAPNVGPAWENDSYLVPTDDE